MGTARKFDDVLKSELNIHAAWLPITNTFEVGDFGIISDGVLVKMGNIQKDFGIAFTEEPGREMQLSFTSKGISTVRSAGGASVQTFPDNDIEAKLSVEFKRESSFLLKAQLTSSEMQNLNTVARYLNNEIRWDRKFRVVSAIYVGASCAIISSKAADSKIELSGRSKALKQFDLGSASTELDASVKKEIGLDIVGKDGVIGLRLFKLGLWSGAAKTLGADDNVSIETTEDWPNSLADDV